MAKLMDAVYSGRQLPRIGPADDLLTPPSQSSTLDWAGVILGAPLGEQMLWDPRSADCDAWLAGAAGRDGDKLFQVLFPFRTKKDLAIRVTRTLDIYEYARALAALPKLREWALLLQGGFDYTSATYILKWALLCRASGFDFFDRWAVAGAFASGPDHYTAFAKYVNDRLKTTKARYFGWKQDLESAVMSGFRNPPYPGFDVREQCEQVAHAGNVPKLTLPEFEAVARRTLECTAAAVPYVSFEAWVLKHDWLTSGSSSEGKLTLRLRDGGSVKVKVINARKNTLIDCVDLADLARRAWDNKEQWNKAVIKSETGKIRIAVAGDLLTYLQMSYIVHLMGGAYKQWGGSTIEESMVQESDRICEMLALITTRVALPFDYSAYDHQPTTTELQCMGRIFCETAEQNVPSDHLAEFRALASRVVGAFDHSFLTWRDGDREGLFRVTGGLMSGLRWTTMFGNAWNTVMTNAVLDLCADAGFDVSAVVRYIRGDDSAIFTDTEALGVSIAWGYKQLNVKTVAGKYALWSGVMEFLRVRFQDGVAFGYAARAFAAQMQRKPWSSAPWDEVGPIRQIWDACNTLKRRGMNTDVLWRVSLSVWCRKIRIPVWVAECPVALGGFGLGVWDGVSVPTERVPRVSLGSAFSVDRPFATRADDELSFAREFSTGLSQSAAAALADDAILATVAADDVPSVSSHLRKKWRLLIRGIRFRKVRFPLPVVHLSAWPDIAVGPGAAALIGSVLRSRAPSFGSEARSAPIVERASRHLKAMGLPFRPWLSLHFPKVADFVSRGGHMAERLDWILGNVSVGTPACHPSLYSLITQQCAHAVSDLPHRGRIRAGTMCYLTSFAVNMLATNRFAQAVWQHR
jgi:hypothetical protein